MIFGHRAVPKRSGLRFRSMTFAIACIGGLVNTASADMVAPLPDLNYLFAQSSYVHDTLSTTSSRGLGFVEYINSDGLRVSEYIRGASLDLQASIDSGGNLLSQGGVFTIGGDVAGLGDDDGSGVVLAGTITDVVVEQEAQDSGQRGLFASSSRGSSTTVFKLFFDVTGGEASALYDVFPSGVITLGVSGFSFGGCEGLYSTFDANGTLVPEPPSLTAWGALGVVGFLVFWHRARRRAPRRVGHAFSGR